MNEKDHDLLIRVDENVKNLILEIKDMRDGTSAQLTDHELRLRRLEVALAMATGGLFILEMILRFIIK